MICFKLPFQSYSADKKEQRLKIYKDFAAAIIKKGTKLVPVPYQVLTHFQPDADMVFKISDLKTPFRDVLDSVSPNVEYFMATFGRSYGHRLRKIALIKDDNNKPLYLIYQQTMEYTSKLVVLDLKNKKDYRVKSVWQVALLIKVSNCPIEELPLLINERPITKNHAIKSIYQGRLKGAGI